MLHILITLLAVQTYGAESICDVSSEEYDCSEECSCPVGQGYSCTWDGWCVTDQSTTTTLAPVVTAAPVKDTPADPVVTVGPIPNTGRFADSFGAVDVTKNDVLDFDDVRRAVQSLSAWANEFNAHQTGYLDQAAVMNLIDAFDQEQNAIERSILALDVNGDGSVDSVDITHYATIKTTAEQALTDLTNDIADARERLGKESMTIQEIQQFFQNARDARRAELLGYFTHLGGSENNPISLADFQRFYSDLMVYMAIMNKVQASVPDFELTRGEYDTYHQNLNVVEVAVPRKLEEVEYDI